jgi:peptidoglycan hydrolase-like protein with peptidoglycan-binding domain
MAMVAGLGLAATTVTAVAAQDNRPDPPNEVVAAAWAAADEARTAAQTLATAAEDDDTGDPQGWGTEAFKQRHRELAERHRDRPGNAWRVHDAMSRGESPAGLGQEQAAAARGLAQARQALDGEERPGRGLGRDRAPGPPDHAGGDDDDDLDDLDDED